MQHVCEPWSPRLLWAFGDGGPSKPAASRLMQEGLDSGPAFADAFRSIASLEAWAVQGCLPAHVAAEIAVAWVRAASACAGLAPSVRPASALSAANTAPLTSHYQEQETLTKVLDRAVAVAERVGATAGLVAEIRAALGSGSETDRLIRLVLLGSSDSPSTWRDAVKVAERLERWCTFNGFSISALTGVRLSTFLVDASRDGCSVPAGLRAGLALMSDSLLPKLPIEHPNVTAVCRVTKRSANKKRLESMNSFYNKVDRSREYDAALRKAEAEFSEQRYALAARHCISVVSAGQTVALFRAAELLDEICNAWDPEVHNCAVLEEQLRKDPEAQRRIELEAEVTRLTEASKQCAEFDSLLAAEVSKRGELEKAFGALQAERAKLEDELLQVKQDTSKSTKLEEELCAERKRRKEVEGELSQERTGAQDKCSRLEDRLREEVGKRTEQEATSREREDTLRKSAEQLRREIKDEQDKCAKLEGELRQAKEDTGSKSAKLEDELCAERKLRKELEDKFNQERTDAQGKNSKLEDELRQELGKRKQLEGQLSQEREDTLKKGAQREEQLRKETEDAQSKCTKLEDSLRQEVRKRTEMEEKQSQELKDSISKCAELEDQLREERGRRVVVEKDAERLAVEADLRGQLAELEQTLSAERDTRAQLEQDVARLTGEAELLGESQRCADLEKALNSERSRRAELEQEAGRWLREAERLREENSVLQQRGGAVPAREQVTLRPVGESRKSKKKSGS